MTTSFCRLEIGKKLSFSIFDIDILVFDCQRVVPAFDWLSESNARF